MSIALPIQLLSAIALAAEATGTPSDPSAGRKVDMLPGVVEASQTVDVTAPMPGIIAEIAVQEMQYVERDQLLASLDDRVARASLDAAQQIAQRAALLMRAQTSVSLAEKFLERVRDAYEKDAASGLELDEAKGRLEEARAGLAKAHEQQREADAQVELERARLQAYQLRAPVAGAVLRILGKPGGAASPNEPILRMSNLSPLRVSLHVPVRYYGQFEVGAVYALEAEPPAPSRIEATLLAQEPVIDAASDTFRCLFEIENSNLSLPAGFAVRLREPAISRSSVSQ